MIKVLLVDDHTVVRQGLRLLLEDCSDIRVVGEAGGGHEALRLARELTPDVAVMDLSMPEMDGLGATKQIASEGLHTKVLILTMHATAEYAARLLQAGAHGFMSKGASGQDVATAIRRVAAGEYYLPPPLAAQLPLRFARRKTASSPLETLSDRELQVLKRLAEGQTSRQIAEELHLSVKTIDTYRARLLAKLSLQTTADLVRFALRHGVLQDSW